ncbi:MAG: hypothetical protein ACKOCG_01485 [Candidatus Nanopelagicus sp.]
MNLSGIKGLVSLAVIVLLVSGCSITDNAGKSDYDPLEVIEYEQCLEAQIEDVDWERIPDGYFKQVWDSMLKDCAEYKPTKQE